MPVMMKQRLRFNCTIEELKLCLERGVSSETAGFNCTIEELKLVSYSKLFVLAACFNCTIEELKFDLHILNVLGEEF